MTGARYVPSPGITEAPIRYRNLVAIFGAGIGAIALVAVVATWIGLGVLASRAAAAKPGVVSCSSFQPHVEAGR